MVLKGQRPGRRKYADTMRVDVVSPVMIAIPVKPFGVAKQRLSPVLDPSQRRRLGKAVAARVIATALDTGSTVAVVTGDGGVADWARRLGASTIAEPKGGDSTAQPPPRSKQLGGRARHG